MKVACIWFSKPTPVHMVAEGCLRFSPQICIREEHAVFIEIGKCHRLYSEEGFLARLQVVLRKLNVSGAIGIGRDIPDSLLVAKYAQREIGLLPLEALIDLADPFGKDPILQKYVAKLISHFRDLGIKNIWDFQKIPRNELATRFGPAGILCSQRSRGEIQVPWPNWKPEEIIREKEEYPYFEFYGELDPILFSLKTQLDHIFTRLQARQLKAQKISVKIFCETNSRNPHKSRDFDFEFLFPQGSTKGTLNVMKERLNKDFAKYPLRTQIQALETTVTAAVKGSAGQKNFMHNREEVAEELSSLLNQLREVHGKENIFQAALTENRLPEKSWKKLEGAAPDPLGTVQTQGTIPQRPTYLMRPEKVEVTADAIYIRKKSFKILKWLSPVEKISGGWFEKAETDLSSSYDRTYYQLDLEGGTRVSLFQTPKQEYFLHGYFG